MLVSTEQLLLKAVEPAVVVVVLLLAVATETAVAVVVPLQMAAPPLSRPRAAILSSKMALT
jgi:hypothetical protein